MKQSEKDKLIEQLKELFDKVSLRYFLFGGFDSYEDYEKYGEAFVFPEEKKDED